jgi:hypothetical protein
MLVDKDTKYSVKHKVFLKIIFYNVNINKFVLKKNRKRQNPVVFPCNFAVEKQ